MTLNDFKAIKGDAEMGIRSLPVMLGPKGAARAACLIMAVPQVIVIGLPWRWQHPTQAGIVSALLIAQLAMMVRFLGAPISRALWYSGFGVPLFVKRNDGLRHRHPLATRLR
jgi:chlorophyll synthase